MSKSFFVLEIVEGKPGKLWERATWDEAVDLAVEFATEQTDESVDEIRKEIEADTDFLSPGGDIHICILQAEDE